MINIAAFIDITNGQLSSKSQQLLLVIQAFKRVNSDVNKVNLFSFERLISVTIPEIENSSLTVFDGLSEAGLFTSDQIKSINNQLILVGTNCILGFKNSITDQIFPSLSLQLGIPLISQVIKLDLSESNILVKQSIFSGKALSTLNLPYSSILSFNSGFDFGQYNGNMIAIQPETIDIHSNPAYSILELKKNESGLNLSDANYVVGAGRGLKDPSNWNIIEELANKLGAATACSKPVSDINWRPHSEHVGQTGIKIAPKMYIACGISGAIQHLAGVNSSKTIVVINNDPEAPFFKYADYGIVGDVFDIVPELLKNL